VGDPAGLNTHAQSEQPQPLKCGSLIQISSRRTIFLTPPAVLRVHDLAKDGLILYFGRTPSDGATSFIILGEFLYKPPLVEHNARPT